MIKQQLLVLLLMIFGMSYLYGMSSKEIITSPTHFIAPSEHALHVINAIYSHHGLANEIDGINFYVLHHPTMACQKIKDADHAIEQLIGLADVANRPSIILSPYLHEAIASSVIKKNHGEIQSIKTEDFVIFHLLKVLHMRRNNPKTMQEIQLLQIQGCMFAAGKMDSKHIETFKNNVEKVKSKNKEAEIVWAILSEELRKRKNHD